MVGVFEQASRRTGLRYPLTHLLYFNTQALRPLMQRWHIDARQYRRAPQQVAAPLAMLGLGLQVIACAARDVLAGEGGEPPAAILLATALVCALAIRIGHTRERVAPSPWVGDAHDLHD